MAVEALKGTKLPKDMRSNHPFSTPRSRKTLTFSLSRKLNNAGPFLSLVAVFVLTGIYYNAIKSQNVELSFDQLSAFERQVIMVGNRSVYTVDPLQRDELLKSLSRSEWVNVASNIDVVAIMYDDLHSVMNPALMQRIDSVLMRNSPKGYGVVSFSCGCFIPNFIFKETQTRFSGFECLILPGFVMSQEHVHFIDIELPDGHCRNRKKVMRSSWYESNEEKLAEARKEHKSLKKKLLNQDEDTVA